MILTVENTHFVLKSPRRGLHTPFPSEEERMLGIIMLVFYRCFLDDGAAEGISSVCSLDLLPEMRAELKEKKIEAW